MGKNGMGRADREATENCDATKKHPWPFIGQGCLNFHLLMPLPSI
ncbi:hypothetical protein EDD73_10790 [Heliophilum fasciatum]|uniref:Uncharacterized protein n=1 Tax=Heliophilum fasciatum TaxID=35700 RepID=A0A4R2RRD9_9FIRM|nr:hypothetical protein [Heliophilum fasciatum]TCP65017.1 hypothetical protein EDD73_10790 [Heliophilum fasciatum]